MSALAVAAPDPQLAGPQLTSPEALQRLMQADHPLSPQQFAAVTAPLAPAVVVAGAGSGKTTLMAARVVWLVGTGRVSPDQVLGLTFTTKAAGELATKVRDALQRARLLGVATGDQPEPLEPHVATYNAYAASLLSEHGLRIGHEPDTRVITDAARYQLAARVVARYDGTVRLLSDHPQTVIGYVLALDSAMSEHLVTAAHLRSWQAGARPHFEAALAQSAAKADLRAVLSAIDRRDELLGLVERYRVLKRQLGLMQFSDQIELAARLADARPEVGAAQRDSFRVVLLDEYQDTSVAQALMLSRLFSGPGPDAGRGHPVTAVGDPKQAIYGWRGASVSNLLRFGEDFPAADGATDAAAYPLVVNYRSDRRILAVANELARPLQAGHAAVQPLQPAPGAAEGAVRVEVFETYDDELRRLPEEVTAARERHGSWREVAVLTRDNAHAADVFRVLSEAEVPVEIVGLKGLLALPEVAEVVATLTLLSDLTANAQLLMLLTGPRWAIGPRDLALLARRAAELGGTRSPGRAVPGRTLAEELAEAVAGADPVEVVSLSDALADPGSGAYSPEARERFALLAAELRLLRAHAGEPLLDLVRRIVDVTGLDVELAASVSAAARARRDNLDLFIGAVAEFEAIDGAVTLPALLAYLEAEDESGGSGLDVATPTQADSVKLLTVHRAKGLEWDAVFLVGVARERFPRTRSRVRWTSGPAVLPTPVRGDARDLPALAGPTRADLARFALDTKAHESLEELRLGYVALTRPRHELWMSSYCWVASRATPTGPSPYQEVVAAMLEGWGEPVPGWRPAPEPGAVHPLRAARVVHPWPVAVRSEEVQRRAEAAALVRAELTAPSSAAETPEVSPAEAELVAAWDRELDRLVSEARAGHAAEVSVPLPRSLSATAVARLRAEPAALAEALARPMPRPPSPAARSGTRFHRWVEAHYQQRQGLLVDLDEIEGRGDAEVDDQPEAEELDTLVAAFLAGPFAARRPVAVEPAFALVLAGQVVRGRIDAVFEEDDGSFLVVDWKTSRAHRADPLQLALYRLAWAELRGVPPERVRAGFCYVRDRALVHHDDLPDRAALAALLHPGGSTTPPPP